MLEKMVIPENIEANYCADKATMYVDWWLAIIHKYYFSKQVAKEIIINSLRLANKY
jgi:hypothetical protein